MISKNLLYSAYRFSTSHLSQNGAQKIIHGTCFYINADGRIFLVTNRHNVDLSYKDQKYAGYQWEGLQVSGYCSDDDYYEISFAGQNFRSAVTKNPAEDLFVFEVTDVPLSFRRKKKEGEDPGRRTQDLKPILLAIDMLADEADMKRLTAGTQVLMPSYSAHYDISSERPVLRGGIISSDPESNYQTIDQEPARRVLYQVQSTEGASGGPVFAIMEDAGVLLGINAGHLTGSEPKIGTIHSGFSYCFKAECIREAIDAIVREGD